MLARIIMAIVALVVGAIGSVVVLYPLLGKSLRPEHSYLIGGALALFVLTQDVTRWPIIRNIIAANDRAATKANANRTRAVAAFEGRTTIELFSSEAPRPAFLNRVRGFYGRRNHSVWFMDRNEGVRCGENVELLHHELNERRQFEALYESARYEMLRRTQPIVDRLNRPIGPDILPEGLLIETIRENDGSTVRIVAVDLGEPLSREEWTKAQQQGIGTHAGAWNTAPIAFRTPRPSGGFFKMNWGVMPLYKVELRELVMPGESNGDPLARSDGGVSYNFPTEWQ